MYKMLPLLVFLLMSSQYLLSQNPKSLSAEVVTSIQTRINEELNPSIVVGLLEDGEVHYYTYGLRDLADENSHVNENTVYEIGSISKVFTGILLADQVIQQKMQLTDPAANYLPAGKTMPDFEGKKIQLVHLSNHTSSLPRLPANFSPANPMNPYADYSEEKLFSYLEGASLSRAIGSQYEYSNLAAGLLGLILAFQAGDSYEKLMVETIAHPLGMKNTQVELSPEMQAQLAKGYLDGTSVPNWDLPALAGAGGIRSTAADMMKFIKANLGLLAKDDLYQAMQLSHQNTRIEGAEPQVGLGWHITKDEAGNDLVWHNGGTGGYRSFTGFIKESQRGVVVLTNSIESVDDVGLHLLDPVRALRTLKLAYAESIPTEVLESYTGNYQLAPGIIVSITREEDKLKAQITGQAAFRLYPSAANRFFYRVVEAEIEFREDGKSLTLYQNGQEIPANKME